jgi:hypothetical protein
VEPAGGYDAAAPTAGAALLEQPCMQRLLDGALRRSILPHVSRALASSLTPATAARPYAVAGSVIAAAAPHAARSAATMSSAAAIPAPVAISPLVAAARDRVKYAAKVPSDIDISQSVEAIHISRIAADAGLTEGEVDLYGPWKAKVHLSVRDRLKDVVDGNYVVVTGKQPPHRRRG